MSRYQEVSGSLVPFSPVPVYLIVSTVSRCSYIWRTSWKSHNGTEPGFALPFSTADAHVRSRHRASTTVPFFSFDTSGCKHKFFRLVSPNPVKFRSFSFCSSVSARLIRYSISLFNSDKAFSISGTVREQYTSFRRVGWNYIRVIMNEVVSQLYDALAGMTQSTTTMTLSFPFPKAFPRRNGPIDMLIRLTRPTSRLPYWCVQCAFEIAHVGILFYTI